MRTTLTLDPDVAALLKKAVARGDVSFKDAVNDALRRGLADRSAQPKKRWVQRVWPDGGSDVLLSPEDMKQRLLDEDTERFLEVTRRQPPPVRD
jgi:hypothetical protein